MAQHGDPGASDVSRLVHEHHAAVYRYAFRLSGSAHEAEDLAQQAFLTAQRSIQQLRDPDRAIGWLLAITRTCFLKSRRRQRPVAAANLELRVESVPEPPSQQEDIDGELLQLAIDELPDDYRSVVLMFYFEQLSYREIADQLSLPIGTVMSRLARGKDRLRQRLRSAETMAAFVTPQSSRLADGSGQKKSDSREVQ